VGKDDCGSAPQASILLDTAAMRAVAPRPGSPAEPSWGRVMATTIRLWLSRSAGFGRRHAAAGQSLGRPGRLRQRAARRWRLVAAVLALAAVVAAALQFAGVFAGTASRAAPATSAGHPPARAVGTPARAAAAAARSAAAAWIAGQVSGDAIIACDPVMCAALQAQGVSAARLLPMRSGSAGPVGANVMVTSPAAGGQLAGSGAPAVIASFGSGDNRIEVRAVVPGGAAAYASALRADLAARMSAGSQLLKNSRMQFTAQDAAQLRAGEVDSRLLATLAALSSQYSFRVTAFGDASPGAAVLFREVTITPAGSGNRAADLAAALALVNAQHPPYLPAHAAIVPPGALSIQFAAPSPLGLLTAVLVADIQGAA